MSAARARKEAAKRLALVLQQRHENLAFARGQDEVTVAAVDLGQCFNDNIEFIINVLRDYGGLTPKFDNPKLQPLPQTPAIFNGQDN